MKNIILVILLFIAMIIESSIASIPLVLDIIIILYIFEKKSWIFVATFVSGLFLDVLLVRVLGQTSLFFVIFLFILSLYERKFETSSIYFALFSSFLGSLIFLILAKENFIFQNSIISAIFTVVLFMIFKQLNYMILF